jgi:hypothetical protein
LNVIDDIIIDAPLYEIELSDGRRHLYLGVWQFKVNFV